MLVVSTCLIAETSNSDQHEPENKGGSGTGEVTASPHLSVRDCSPIDKWLNNRRTVYKQRLLENISPTTLPSLQEGEPIKKGFLAAAPWIFFDENHKLVQNYCYHWVRDSALVMNTLVTDYLKSPDDGTLGRIVDYLNFSRENQVAGEKVPKEETKVSNGEVKFEPDGKPFTKWMRPQDDGPALRAITAIRFVSSQLKQGKKEVATHIYEGTPKTLSTNEVYAPGLIKSDLEYLVEHLDEPSYEPWEEVKGHTFYTRLVQIRALREGETIARELGDNKAARRFREGAKKLNAKLAQHWIAPGEKNPVGGSSQGQIWDSFDREAGPDYKKSGLDLSTILASLHANELGGDRNKALFSPSDDRVLKTALELSAAFKKEFPINTVETKCQDGEISRPLAPAIGRYPFDQYNGYIAKEKGGNPWFLGNAAFAELYYRAALEWKDKKVIVVTKLNQDLLTSLLKPHSVKIGEKILLTDPRFKDILKASLELGDSYLRQIQVHEKDGGHLNEEFHRETGKPTGAEDLSWSYASVLTADAARTQLVNEIGQ